MQTETTKIRGLNQPGPRPAFTLIELLVVVAIVALLIAILLPSLGQVRAAGKLAVCGSNLRQLGAAVHAYSFENMGFIPRGPQPAHNFDFSGNRIATNQLWVGTNGWAGPPANPRQYQGWGGLLVTTCPDARVYFCPGDDNFEAHDSLPKIGSDEDAYGSYMYRQLDQLPADSADGRLDSMGANDIAGVSVPVEALALDMNSLGAGPLGHTNHAARAVNILFRDASVRRFVNRHNCLALPPEAFSVPPNILSAIDQLLINADAAYGTGRPDQAPRLDTPP